MGLISNFPQNKKLPVLNNPASADMIMEGYEAIDSDRQVVTGTFTLEEEKTEQDSIIEQIKTALANKCWSQPVEFSNGTLKIY